VSPGIPILTFHALDAGRDVCGYPPGVFRGAVARLAGAGIRTLPLADAVAALAAGRVPDRAVCITFDDGYRSVYTDAVPALRAHGMTATVFLTVGETSGAPRLPSLQGREMLAWSEVRELAGAGIALGAHSLAHCDLTRVPPERVEREMVRSKAVIEDRAGVAVRGFAYPFGRFDARSRALARAHFAFAVADTLALATAASDAWALPRVDAYYLRAPWTMPLVASAWLPAYVRARNLPRSLRRALRRR
jgi:peptidoglycan/xylan/chitin deacetylase (PgdA/CDA1 family)